MPLPSLARHRRRPGRRDGTFPVRPPGRCRGRSSTRRPVGAAATAPGAGHRAGRPRRHPRPHQPGARHRHPGLLAGRRRVVVLPLPMRMGSIEEFVAQTRARIRHGDAKLLLIDDELAPFFEPAPGDPPMASLGAVADRAAATRRRGARAARRPIPKRLVILQYTSGSTSEPKGVMIPDRVLGAQPRRHRRGRRAGRRRRRDGVVAAALPRHGPRRVARRPPMTTGADLVQAAPQDFLAQPGRWMRVDLRLRRHGHRRPQLLVGAGHPGAAAHERARPVAPAHRARTAPSPSTPTRSRRSSPRPAPSRLPPRRGVPGLRHGRGGHRRHLPAADARAWCVDAVDRVVLETERVAKPADPGARRHPPACRCSAGPCPGLEIRIVEPATGEELPERQVGELEIRGTSVTPGYYKRPDATADAVPRRLAAHRRPRLPARRRARPVRAHQGRHHRRRSQRVPRGHRTGRGGRSTACGPATSSPSASRATRARRASWSSPRCVTIEVDSLGNVRRAIHAKVIDVCGLPPRDVMLRATGQPAEDHLGQASAVAVP